MKVLALIYAISPSRGSEYSVGWNYAAELSQDHDVHVLYGCAGMHMGEFGDIVPEDIETTFPRLKMIRVVPDIWCNILNFANKSGIFKYSFYLAYRRWHGLAFRAALELCENEAFDVVHFVSPIGFREPGYMRRLGIPYMWGPIGGVVPQLVRRPVWKFSFANCLALLKNVVTQFQFRHSGNVATEINEANKIVAATTDTAAYIFARFGRIVDVWPENGIREIDLRDPKETSALSPFRFVWVGSLDDRKSPDLFIEALAQIGRKCKWEAVVVGAGPMLQRLSDRVRVVGIADRVRFTGAIPRVKVLDEIAASDIHVITSMAEGNPTVLWEAMSCGVPTVTLDHCGMHDTVCEECGVKIPIGTVREMILSLSNVLRSLAMERNRSSVLRSGVLLCRRNHLWSVRRRQIEQGFDDAIADHKRRHDVFNKL